MNTSLRQISIRIYVPFQMYTYLGLHLSLYTTFCSTFPLRPACSYSSPPEMAIIRLHAFVFFSADADDCRLTTDDALWRQVNAASRHLVTA
jgi:hypothetical protein